MNKASLDFADLDSLFSNSVLEEQPNRPPNKELQPLQQIARKSRGNIAAAEEVFRIYNENRTKTRNLQKEILTGITKGENTLIILLKAVKCISLMINDSMFYSSAEREIKKIHCDILESREAVEMEIHQVEARLKKLNEAKKGNFTNKLDLINAAIEKHEQYINELKNKLKTCT